MRYVRWATMWHVSEDPNYTLCGRKIPRLPTQIRSKPEEPWLCSTCDGKARASQGTRRQAT